MLDGDTCGVCELVVNDNRRYCKNCAYEEKSIHVCAKCGSVGCWLHENEGYECKKCKTYFSYADWSNLKRKWMPSVC